MNKQEYQRGDIYLVQLDPTIGSEIQKTRPCIIVSRSDYNQVAEVITVIPVSTGRYLEMLHVKLDTTHHLEKESHAVIPQIRVASKKRLVKHLTSCGGKTMLEIEEKMKFFLGINT